jgi:hypothetical protein
MIDLTVYVASAVGIERMYKKEVLNLREYPLRCEVC